MGNGTYGTVISSMAFEIHEILNTNRCAALSHLAINSGILDIQILLNKMGKNRKKEPDIEMSEVGIRLASKERVKMAAD